VTPIGLALVVYLTKHWVPAAAGSGIPQTVAALYLRDAHAPERVLPLRIAIGKILLTLRLALSGASVGREGPTVHIGASIVHAIGRRVRFPTPDVERGLLVSVGGAAGVAAAFNTPLAGIVSAIEELSRSYEHRTSGVILTAVIIASVTAVAFLGNYTYLGVTNVTLGGGDWIAALICGVGGGLAGGLFARSLQVAARGLAGWVRLCAADRSSSLLSAVTKSG